MAKGNAAKSLRDTSDDFIGFESWDNIVVPGKTIGAKYNEPTISFSKQHGTIYNTALRNGDKVDVKGDGNGNIVIVTNKDGCKKLTHSKPEHAAKPILNARAFIKAEGLAGKRYRLVEIAKGKAWGFNKNTPLTS